MSQSVRVPVKVIITGEHAVVHGAPAIATAANLYSRLTVRLCSGNICTVTLNAYQYTLQMKTFWSVIDALKNNSPEGAQQVLPPENKKAFGLIFILARVFDELGVNEGDIEAFSIDIESVVGPGSGLGFSAGYTAGLFKVFCNIFNKGNFFTSRVEEVVSHAERFFHGTPSGIDQYAILHGGFFEFNKNNQEIISIPTSASFLDSLFLVYTGKPQSSTKEAVEKARVYFEKYGIEKYIDVYKEIKTSVLDGSAERFSDALRKNQQLLSATGVSSEYADALAKKVESAGGALKITGAGTAHGKEVGMMLGYHPDREKLEKMFKNEGLTSFYISCNVSGLMD